jgi:hypothetical protein
VGHPTQRAMAPPGARRGGRADPTTATLPPEIGAARGGRSRIGVGLDCLRKRTPTRFSRFLDSLDPPPPPRRFRFRQVRRTFRQSAKCFGNRPDTFRNRQNVSATVPTLSAARKMFPQPSRHFPQPTKCFRRLNQRKNSVSINRFVDAISRSANGPAQEHTDRGKSLKSMTARPRLDRPQPSFGGIQGRILSSFQTATLPKRDRQAAS